MILPRIKQIRQQTGYFEKKLTVDEVCIYAQEVVDLIALFAPCAEVTKEMNGNVTLHEKTTLKSGAYEMVVKHAKVEIFYGDYEGVRNAVATLVQLYKNGKIECCEIKDAPDHEFRSCMLDLARGYVDIPVLKEHIVRMALLKFNHLHLHLMDRQSYILQSDVVPNPDGHKQYTKAEMAEIVAFCKMLCLEVIPEIEIPAHAVNQLKALPQLGCEIIDKKLAMETIKKIENATKMTLIDTKRGVSAWTVCAGNELTYEIYEKIVAEICEIFDGRYVHIGGDELEFPAVGAYPHWSNCVHCKQRMESEGLGTIRELYYYVIRRMHAIVTKHGKKMMIWDDQLDVLNPIDIPKDIIVEFWHGNMITKEKGTFQKLLDQGFTVINAKARYTYVDFPHYMKEEKIRDWTVKTDLIGEPELVGDLIGAEMCAWELGNPLYAFYTHSLPVCMALFSDRVWNDQPAEYDEDYKNAVFGTILGKFDCSTNPFFCFKEMIPPRSKTKPLLEEIDLEALEKEQVAAIYSYLNDLQSAPLYGKYARDAYVALLNTILWALK